MCVQTCSLCVTRAVLMDVTETTCTGSQVGKVSKLPRLSRRLGVNGNRRPLFPRVFSGIGFLDIPLLLVKNWLKLTTLLNH